MNGWTTKHHMSIAAQGCRFGCLSGGDSMPHYVAECSALRAVMEEVFPTQVAGPFTCVLLSPPALA